MPDKHGNITVSDVEEVMNGISKQMQAMNAKGLLIKALRDIGADGLYNGLADDESCGCGIDDLEPCGSISISDCRAAIKKGNGYYPMEENK